MKALFKNHREILILLFFVGIVVAFFYRTIFYGKLPVPADSLVGLYHPYRDTLASQYPQGIPFKNFLITDPVRQQIPWRKSAVEAFAQGKLPLWNPYSFSGTPLLANIQAGAFYPLNIFFSIFPFDKAWSLLIISQPLLGGIFLYWFLRRKKLGVAASVFGATCFSFSGFSIAWLTWGTILSAWLWTPLTMLAFDSLCEPTSRRRAWWFVICTLSLVSSFLAGHIQIFIYSALLFVAYIFWHHQQEKRIKLFTLLLTLGAGALVLVSFQIIRIMQWLPETSRIMQGAAWKSEGFFIPIQHLIQFLVPDFFGNPATLNYWGVWNYGEMIGYIGVIGLVFACLGVTRRTVFWIITITLGLLFSIESSLSTLPYQLHIPIISSLQPTRLLVIVDFSLCILAAYGFSRVIHGIKKKNVFAPVLVLSLCYVALWASVLTSGSFGLTVEQAVVAKRNLLVPTGMFVVAGVILLISVFLAGKMRKRLQYVLIILIFSFTIIDLFRFGWKFTPFTDKSYFFPTSSIISYLQKQQKPFRIMTTDDRILPPNVNEYYGLESIAGYDPIHAVRYEEFMAAMERGKADISGPFGLERIIVPKNIRSPLMALLNVRYVLSFDEINSPDFKKVATEGKTFLYETTNFLPRAYLVEKVIYKNSKQDSINELYSETFDPRKAAVVEYPLSVVHIPLSVSEGTVIKTYREDEIHMEVTAAQSRLLVIHNIYDRHWRVFIDQKPGSIHLTNYLFMGVVIPEGTHSVVLKYN